jgi:leucyl aminopeptidase
MDIEVINKRVSDIEADCEIIFIVDKKLDHKWVVDKEILQKLDFQGKDGDIAYLCESDKIYVGIEKIDRDEIRIATATALKTLKKTNYKSVKIGSYVKSCPPIYTKAIVEGAVLGVYEFDLYKSKKSKRRLQKLIISTEEYNDKELGLEYAKNAATEAKQIAQATNFAKDIVNRVPDDMTPDLLAKEALKLSKELENVECFVGDEEFLKEQKMGAFLAVSRASAHKPRFIHLSYKPKDPKGTLTFVGKGLTYDSGGLSLKPSEHMVSMKADKSGSAAVLGIIKVRLNLKFLLRCMG